MKKPQHADTRSEQKISGSINTKPRIRSISISIKSLSWLARWCVYILLSAMPFHAFVVVVLGHVFGMQLIIASWKEVIIIMLIVLAFSVGIQRDFLWLRRPANVMVGVLVLAGIIGVVVSGRNDISVLAGVKTTLLPLLAFVAVQPFAADMQWRKLRLMVFTPALIVMALAVVQFLVAPTLLLQSLGYGPSTIQAYQAVTFGSDMGRSFATLGGPNQLGAYLILPTVWFGVLSVTARSRRDRLLASVGTTLGVMAIATTFSRSAALGLGVSLVVALTLFVPRNMQPFVAIAQAVTALFGWLELQNLARIPGSFVQQFLIRGQVNDVGMIIGSDEGHVYAWRQGMDQALAHPVGLGFGSAGPASKYGVQYFLTENWYVQVLLEVGWLGAAAFVWLFVELYRRWWRALDRTSIVLLASLSGILVANLFLHTFADSTLSIIWWLLAGLSYGTDQKRRHDGA